MIKLISKESEYDYLATDLTTLQEAKKLATTLDFNLLYEQTIEENTLGFFKKIKDKNCCEFISVKLNGSYLIKEL